MPECQAMWFTHQVRNEKADRSANYLNNSNSLVITPARTETVQAQKRQEITRKQNLYINTALNYYITSSRLRTRHCWIMRRRRFEKKKMATFSAQLDTKCSIKLLICFGWIAKSINVIKMRMTYVIQGLGKGQWRRIIHFCDIYLCRMNS